MAQHRHFAHAHRKLCARPTGGVKISFTLLHLHLAVLQVQQREQVEKKNGNTAVASCFFRKMRPCRALLSVQVQQRQPRSLQKHMPLAAVVILVIFLSHTTSDTHVVHVRMTWACIKRKGRAGEGPCSSNDACKPVCGWWMDCCGGVSCDAPNSLKKCSFRAACGTYNRSTCMRQREGKLFAEL